MAVLERAPKEERGGQSRYTEAYLRMKSESEVTDDFIAYIRGQGPQWDLDEATEFLVVAATLLDLKAARLLPSGEVEDEEDIAVLEARDLLLARLLLKERLTGLAALLRHGLELDGEPLKIWKSHLDEGRGQPGEVLAADATGLLVASMGVTYPEVAPFVVLSIGVYALRLRLFARAGLPVFLRRVVVIGVLTFLFMGINTYEFANTLILQSLGSAGLGAMADIARIEGLVLFPWTLVPSFLPMVFGLHPFGEVGSDPSLSILIALGIVMMGFLLYRTARALWRGVPVVRAPWALALGARGLRFSLIWAAVLIEPTMVSNTIFTSEIVRALSIDSITKVSTDRGTTSTNPTRTL